MSPANYDPLLEAIRPGVLLVFSAAIAAVAAALLVDAVLRMPEQLRQRAERRRLEQLQVLKRVIQDYRRFDDQPPDPGQSYR